MFLVILLIIMIMVMMLNCNRLVSKMLKLFRDLIIEVGRGNESEIFKCMYAYLFLMFMSFFNFIMMMLFIMMMMVLFSLD